MIKKKADPKRRRATIRQGIARPWPADTQDERLRDALANELIGVCMQALKTFDLDGRRLAKLATRVAARASERTSTATEVLTDTDQLGHAISKWAEEPAYRDVTGRPAVLSVRARGHRGFDKLAHEFFPGWDVEDVVTLGCKANVLERVGSDKVALLNNCVLYPGNSPLILAFAIRTVRRVLHAADFNRRVTSAIEGWPDRAVWVEVTDEDFRDFVKFIRPQIGGLLEISHRWLTRRSALPRNRRRKKRLSGIQIFVFRE
ncbi:MAG: hypothetical protein ACLQFT_13540 [Steroidobacteraceae bacterium]